MNISDKIRFLRKKLHITQDNLAKETGIHPVSIRKYETNKMKPQIEQIERIAGALNINSLALLETGHKPVETVGDFYCVLIHLYKSNVVSFNQSLTNRENIDIEINPNILKLLTLNNHINGVSEEINYNTYSVSINDKIKHNSSYSKFVLLVDCYNHNAKINNIEEIELELQQCTEMLENL